MRTTMKSSQPNGLDDAPTRMRAPDEMRATTWMTTLVGSNCHSHSHSHPAVAKSKVSESWHRNSVEIWHSINPALPAFPRIPIRTRTRPCPRPRPPSARSRHPADPTAA